MSRVGRWECERCTYLNGPEQRACEMCGTEAVTSERPEVTAPAPAGRGGKRTNRRQRAKGLDKLASDRRSRELSASQQGQKSAVVAGTPSRTSHLVQEALESERKKAEERLQQEAELIQRKMAEEMARTAHKLEEAKLALSAQRQAFTVPVAQQSQEVRVLSSRVRREMQEQRIAIFRASEKLREDELPKGAAPASKASSSRTSNLPFVPETDLDEKVLGIYMNRPKTDTKRPAVPLRKLAVGKYIFGTQVVRVADSPTSSEVVVLPASSVTFSALLDQMEPVEAKKLQALSAARGILVF